MGNNFNGVISGAPSPINGNEIFTHSLQLWVKQRNALIRDNWKEVEKLADQGIGNAHASYQKMIQSLGKTDSMVKETTDNLAVFFKFHASQKDTRKEFFTEMKKQLLKIQPNTPAKRLTALDALGEGNIAHNLILESFKGREPEDPEMVDRAIDSTVALGVRSVMSVAYTNFNQHLETLSGYPFEVHKEELLDYFKDVIQQFDDTLEAPLKRLYDDLIKGRAPQPAAERLALAIQEALPQFGRALASLHLYIAALRKANAGVATLEKIGKLSSKAGSLMRDGFAYYAAANYCSLESKAVKKASKAAGMLKGGFNTPYESTFPNGKDTRLSHVNSVANGTYIEVGGYVTGLTARKDGDGKLLSVVTLTDMSGSASVEAVGVFVQLRNMGLQEGAYCTLSGTWKKQSTINKGNAAIEIEQLRINELSEKSWKTAFADLADKFVDRWPGGLNIAYGVSPHVSGGPEGDSKKLGAGELIFKPFYR